MAASLGAILKKILLRWLIYLLGLVVVLGLLGVGAFVLAKPQIDELVQREIKKRGVEIESWDVSLSGRMNLHKMRLGLPDGTVMQANQASVRPPLAGFAGAATLYDVHLERGDVVLTMPELDIAGIEMREKDPHLPSKALQTVMQFDIGSLTSPHIRLTSSMAGKEAVAQVEEFALDGFSRGKIDRLRLAHVTTNMQDSVVMGSGAVEIRDIDAASVYAYLVGQLPEQKDSETGHPIVGTLTIGDVQIDLSDLRGKPVHLSVGSLRSQGLALRSAAQPPIDMLRRFLENGRSDQDMSQFVRSLIQSLTAFDWDIANADVTFGNLQGGFRSFVVKPGNWRQIIPENLDINVAGLVLDLSHLEGDEIDILKAMDYARAELSLNLSINWHEATRQLRLARLDVDVDQMGMARVTGSFAPVDKAFFALEMAQMAEMGQNIALHDLDVTLQDQGAIRNIVAFLTRSIDIGADEVMEHLETMAQGVAGVLFEDAAQQEVTRQALVAFLRDSARLEIRMAPTEESHGLSLALLDDESIDLHSLVKQLNLTLSREAN